MSLAAFLKQVVINPDLVEDIERSHGIYAAEADLGSIVGVHWECPAGHHHILINQRLNTTGIARTYQHEAYHVFVGTSEVEAEKFASKVLTLARIRKTP